MEANEIYFEIALFLKFVWKQSWLVSSNEIASHLYQNKIGKRIVSISFAANGKFSAHEVSPTFTIR